ncbi:MAG: BamA/TamA family outer membrane protein, partial [Candidatus Babeliales bacterium]
MPGERFYLGGAHSIRGYEADLAPPLAEVQDVCSGKTYAIPQGGKFMLSCNIEVRIPFKNNITSVFFHDIGLLSQDSFACNKERPYVLMATGCGLRYETPMGPLRFDIGWRWFCEKKEEASYAWFLTFGQAF